MDDGKIVSPLAFHPDWCRCAFCSTGRFFREKTEDETVREDSGQIIRMDGKDG